MFPVFSNLSDLSQKESIKERQNIEVKRTKTKSLVAQTSVTKKKKKIAEQWRVGWSSGAAPNSAIQLHVVGLGSSPPRPYSPYKFLLRAGLRAVQVVFDHRSSYMLDSLFSLSMVGMVTELASCVQFQGRVTIYFFPLPLFLRPQAEPTYVSRVFQFVRLKSKRKYKRKTKHRSEKNKNKEFGSTDECNQKKKKIAEQWRVGWSSGAAPNSAIQLHVVGLGSSPPRPSFIGGWVV